MDLLYLFILGSIWIMVSITVTKGHRTGITPTTFYCIGNFFSALLFGLIMLFFTGMDDITSPEKQIAFWCIVIGSVINGCGQALTMYNLKSGATALAIAIPQMAFTVPFIASMVFWGESVVFSRIAGVFIIALSVFIAGLKKKAGSGKLTRNKTLKLALVSVMILGISLTVIMVPAYMAPDVALARTTRLFFYMLTAGMFFSIFTFREVRKNIIPPARGYCWALIWGVIATISNGAAFFCLDYFAQKSQAGLVYAVGAAVLIAGFTLYTRLILKEKVPVTQYIGFTGMIIGLFLVRLGV